MTQLPNNFGSLRQPDGRRLDMNFQAIRDSLVGTDASAASLAARVTTAEADILALEQGCFASVSVGTFSVPNNSVTNVNFNTLHRASNGTWWAVGQPQRLVIPVEGYYNADAGCGYGSGALVTGTTRVALWIWSSRDSVIAGDDKTTPATGTWLSCSTPIRYMDAGDYYVAQVFQNSGAARNASIYLSANLHGIGS